MSGLVSSCVWQVTGPLVVAIDRLLGEPTDAYVNGSQTWLRDDGPGGETVEWRLHPVPAYRAPAGLSHYEVFAAVALGEAEGDRGPAAAAELWDGLEAFIAFGEDVEPAPLGTATAAVVGVAPDAVGLVDHESVAEAWERARGEMSITDALLAQLAESG